MFFGAYVERALLSNSNLGSDPIFPGIRYIRDMVISDLISI